MSRVRLSAEAEEELVAAAAWYEEKPAGLGIELVARLDAALEQVAATPESCPLWRPDRPYRQKVLSRFPYNAPPPQPPVKPGNSRYVALLRMDAVAESSGPRPEAMAMMEEYMQPLVAEGTILGGEGLKPSAKRTRVRRMAKQRFVVDGPFAESKELIAGYMLVQARSLDEAVDLIRPWLQIHRVAQGVPFSAIEVRRLAQRRRRRTGCCKTPRPSTRPAMAGGRVVSAKLAPRERCYCRRSGHVRSRVTTAKSAMELT